MDDEQQQKIQQEFTGVDYEEARNLLARNSNDPQMAIRAFLDEREPELERSVGELRYRGQIGQPSTSNDDETVNRDANTRPVLPVYHSVILFLARLVSFPVRLPIFFFSLIYGFFFGRSVTNRVLFRDHVMQKYPIAAMELDNWYTGNTSEIIDTVQNTGARFLVVYIHNPKNSDHEELLKVLLNTQMGEYISEKRGLLAGIMIDDPYAFHYAGSGYYERWHAFTIYLKKDTANVIEMKSLVKRYSDPEETVRCLKRDIDAILSEMNSAALRRRQAEENRRLMEEQNRQYQESVRLDRERMQKQKEEREAKERAAREAEEKQRLSDERVAKIKSFRENLEDKGPSTGSHQYQLRFPSGNPLKLKFHKSDRVESIFEAAIKSPDCPIFFQVHTIMPKNDIPCLPDWYYDILVDEEKEPEEGWRLKDVTFEEAGVEPGSTIYVDSL
ncbi:unnamed protein product [Caenorhabditis bovis]|uniref:UBX domain-containing protein n=1 Tax=Caenorhabditis bovis TaxID=2654633 RepID=A0A8S1F947_9PELO|nr:unnamed protein product [Caenorhabditis bovis]